MRLLVYVPFLVEFYSWEQCIGYGTVVDQPNKSQSKKVHNKTLLADEVKIQVHDVYVDQETHPIYTYTIDYCMEP